jgi:NADPH:quinone reductase-like Zn-dependent oxidoreductase
MEPAKSSHRDLQALAGLSGQQLLPVMPRPVTMRALELRAYDGVSLVYVSNRPVPTPGPGEVLVRVHSTPVSAADMLFLHGRYGVQRPLPVVPGLECSGLVVASGGGLLGRALLGRRVAATASPSSDGTWAEYVCLPAWQCLPLRSYVDFEQGAALLSTSVTAWALLDLARARGAKAVAQTAGDSPLGRMLAQLALRRRLPMLHIIERAEQGEALAGLGATQIVNSSTSLYPHQLSAAFESADISVVIEANAGPHTDLLLRALPAGGTMLVAGSQPDADCTIDPTELVFRRKSMEGFLLCDWMSRTGYPRAVQAALAVQRLLGHDARQDGPSRLPLDSYHKALDLMFRGRISDGQVLFSLLRDN